jgi:hypothetical protein
MVRPQSLARRPLETKKAKAGKSKPAGKNLLYAKKLHETDGRFRRCWGPARRLVTAFLETQMQDVVNYLRNNTKRKTITLADVFEAVRGCNSFSVAEHLIDNVKSAPGYEKIYQLSKRQKKAKAT